MRILHRIPRIYRLARAHGKRMPALVNEALAQYLTEHGEDPSTVTVASPAGLG